MIPNSGFELARLRIRDMDEIKGYINSIKFRNELNGYTVFVLVSEKKEIKCVGNIPAIDPGENVCVKGEYTVHPDWGEQFKVSSFERIIATDVESVIRYLSSGAIKGVGVKLALRMADKFGDELAMILEKQPERLSEIKGISAAKAREIAIQYKEKNDTRRAFIFLNEYGLSANMSIQVYEKYGDEIYRIMKENPYRLAEDIRGIGFKKADEIARKAGIEVDSEYRIASGILYVVESAAGEGNVYIPMYVLTKQASALLGISEDLISEGVQDLAVHRKLVIKTVDDKSPRVYAAEYYYTEMKCAALLRDLSFSNAYSAELNPAAKVDAKLSQLERETGIEYDELQREAVHAAASEGIVIVTGGPGTGKTTAIKAMIRYFTDEGMDIMLAAPTGRAAKRMTEATGYEARTIHRMLEIASGLDDDNTRIRFERNEDNPLETDVIIVDEMSMVDMFIFKSLLLAISPGTRLIMVGDIDQLPSVGPGQVLRDLCDSEAFRVVRLDVIFRQSENSDIVINAHEIRAGRYPRLDNKSKDFFFIAKNSEKEVCDRLVSLIAGSSRDTGTPSFAEYAGTSSYEIQVLTPMRKGTLGVEGLNRVLQEHMNPPSPSKREIEYGNMIIREGDKVMQIRNDYQAEWEMVGDYNIVVEKGTGIFNGDIGKVVYINEYEKIVTVEFDEGKMVDYDYPHLEDLELAYAITIHKSQGSEYPAVILPLLPGPNILMNRNLLYTAVTRARKCVVIIGRESAVKDMVDNGQISLRCTGLAGQIKEVMNR